jgi:hypothetical protein
LNELKVKIVSYTEDSNPGWVMCTFQDIYGKSYSFEEKVPIVTEEYLDSNSEYPKDGVVACQVLTVNNKIITVDISKPYCIQTEEGLSVFDVFADQLK